MVFEWTTCVFVNGEVATILGAWPLQIRFNGSAVITPTQDIVNMLIFALPMLALFEVGVFLVGRLERRKSRV